MPGGSDPIGSDPGVSRPQQLPQLSAAGWLAATGASMLLLASIVVVAGRWESITPEIRFSGLVAALLAVYFTAEALRSRLVSTATSLATLAAALTAPVGVAAAATLSQPWPVCVLVGGLAALAATEVQSRRWDVPALKAATTVAAGMTATGLAALTGAPVAVIGSGAAVLFAAMGARRRSIVLGASVGLATLLPALAQIGIGPGTIERIGGTGDHLVWSAPTSALIAALVIAFAAHRRRDLSLVALSVATATSGAIAGLVVTAPHQLVWWSLPAIALVAVELVRSLTPRSVWSQAADLLRPFVLVPVAFGAAVSPFLVMFGRIDAEFTETDFTAGWVLPIALTAGALWVSAAGAFGRDGAARIAAAIYAAACTASLAAVMATGSTWFGWPEIATLGAVSMLTAAVGRTRPPAWGHVAAAVAVATTGLAVAQTDLGASWSSLMLVSIGIALSGIAFVRPAFTPLDTMALGTAVLALLASLAAAPSVGSLVGALVAGQLTMYAMSRREFVLATVSSAAMVAAVVSSWWTTGTNDVVIEAIAPHGADGVDLAIGAASLLLLAIGALVRRFQVVSSWLAFGPGLGMATAWLLDSQFDDSSTWATATALAFGVIATGIGGFRRLGAPLVIGTGLIAFSTIISIGSRLAAAPTWAWIAAGGIGLIILAAVIERTDRPLIAAGPDSEHPSLLQQFCRDFD